MLTKRDLLRSGTEVAAVVAGARPGPALAQMLTGTPAEPNLKYSTATPPGVAIRDTLETRLGKLNFFGNFPDQSSVDKLYDNLDFQRAVQAYLLGLPVVNQVGNRDGILSVGFSSQHDCADFGRAWSIRVRWNSPPTTTLRTLGSGSIYAAGHSL